MIRLPSADDPAVSLIVLLDGAPEMCERCLRAIAAAEGAVPFETLVLLNDPDPELEDLVRGSTSGGRVIVPRGNAGPGVGWNLGAAVARAPRLATLHEDAEPEPDWLAALCETMEETGAGAVGSRLFNADGSVQNCGWTLFSDASVQQVRLASAPAIVAATEPTPADVLSGASMLVDREAVRAAGGWDERFHPAVYGDIDISTAIWAQGRIVLSVPSSRVLHESGAFNRRPRSALTGRPLREFLGERNRDRFLAKWGAAMRDLAPPPPDLSPEAIAPAVEAALAKTRERAERIRSGDWPADRARTAEPRFSGIADPALANRDDRFYEVAPEISEALNRAESDLVDEYCRWLVPREEETHRQLEERLLELGELYRHAEHLERQNQQLGDTLDGILGGRTWRLRARVAKLLRRS